MLIFKLSVILLCSFLFWLGGYSWKPARRFIMPVLITGLALFLTHDLWTLTMLSCMGCFSMGYGEFSPLRHIFGNGWGRGVWGILSAICLSLALFLTHHLEWYLFVPYLALNFTLENALKNVDQRIGDIIIGAGFASIVLLIH